MLFEKISCMYICLAFHACTKCHTFAWNNIKTFCCITDDIRYGPRNDSSNAESSILHKILHAITDTALKYFDYWSP